MAFMTVHIIKLCVGAESIEDLADWQARQVARMKKSKQRPLPCCGTRAWPKRREDVLAGGSLYWVIKGVVSVRQKIVAIDDVVDNHGQRCGLYLDAHLQRTAPQPRRAFQGWRYLDPKDAPPDLGTHGMAEDGSPELALELSRLGLI